MTKRIVIKPSRTKAQIRDELERQVSHYLSDGGEVTVVPNGVSGNEDNANLFRQTAQFEPKKARTPVTEVIQQLDARKKSKSAPLRSRRGPRRKLITDDFGEPLRWVWDEK